MYKAKEQRLIYSVVTPRWLLLLLLLLLSSFTSLGTGRCTQEAEPVQGAYP